MFVELSVLRVCEVSGIESMVCCFFGSCVCVCFVYDGVLQVQFTYVRIQHDDPRLCIYILIIYVYV